MHGQKALEKSSKSMGMIGLRSSVVSVETTAALVVLGEAVVGGF
ncbi:MAG: hypothetical protein OFPI_08060 [Osedax symbiont Rs2]|nr:MAG: hypothetical protein OFPI_08060 [Osedax symbiont Rs2]